MSSVEVVCKPTYQISLNERETMVLVALFHGALPRGKGNEVLGKLFAQLAAELDMDESELYDKYEKLVNSDYIA